ncbi:tetratricopeptide repeat protein [Fulvivirga sp. RKSG066]|uniref:tetratricopeptide repeat-containing sensor histidine kinase n=1 Tax=Fulvivirga aurantia TaxID=2529383 RepID=UPI0012BBA37F|nr:tetratricopeptide repeat protein [Fulvivirga aurantia]MTI23032.1 tetratricopeptide repeat protein [Fulvivirga aurantia]
MKSSLTASTLTVALLIVFSHICEAQSRLDSIENVLPQLSGLEKVDALNDLGFNYAFHSIKKARIYSYKGLAAAREANYPEGEVRALINVGYSHFDHNNIDSAVIYFEDAKIMATDASDNAGLANSLNALGIMMKNKGNYPQATKYYQECLETQTRINSLSGMASAYNNIGDVMRTVGNYDKAVEYFLKALEINKKRNDTRRIALILGSIALLYIDQQEEKLAMGYLQQMKELEGEMGYKRLASLHNSLGLVAVAEKDYKEAERQYNLAQGYIDSLGGSGFAIKHNLADLHRKTDQYPKALKLAKSVLAQKKEKSSMESVLMSIDLVADIYFDMQEYDKALATANEAYELADELQSIERQTKSASLIAECYAILGNYQKAWEYKKQLTAVRDSLFNAQKVEQQETLLALYKAEENEKTIALQKANLETQQANIALSNTKNNQLTMGVAGAGMLTIIFVIGFIKQRKSNKLLNLKNHEIATRDHEKDVLLKEIHHRVKNNLQIISSILNIQSRKLDDPKARKAVAEGRSRIKSMSLIHEKLYSNDQMSVINMKEYIEELSEYLFSTYKPSADITRSIETSDLKLDIDTAIPLGLILNELVSNSLKYAFKTNNNGQLKISLSQQHETYTLKVADTGSGLPDNYMKVKNMGLRLVNSLTEQLDGILDVKNENGAQFTLTFKPRNLALSN